MTDVWKHKCGCKLKKEGNSWVTEEFCLKHKPNYSKKGEEWIHSREKLEKRKKYLKLRQLRKKI